MKEIQYVVVISYCDPCLGVTTDDVTHKFNSITDAALYIEEELHAIKSGDAHYKWVVNGDVWMTFYNEFWIEKLIFENGKLVYRGA